MTWFEVFVVAQSIALGGATVVTFILRAGVKSGRWLQMPGDIDKRLTAVEQRMEKAGQQVSTLTTTVQGMPERLRTVFVSQDRLADALEQAREDRLRLWEELYRQRDEHRP